MANKFYEIITDGTPSDFIVGNTALNEIEVDEREAQLLLEEARHWEHTVTYCLRKKNA